ncbi:hypothetical protein JYU34_004563 [Plutella xylostella]|uniref:Chitin-binding type-2 domain-containing protein n=1 Tax=Plutella xylostella TaxID=51655 RepID=A0ABQ7QYA5_PLUXY|nr:uncharacterized protein LOC105384402 [Plutella xylostella]KAG7310030.1 hypothetical protein JYU34_004563 [Plutella xylostella]
MWVRKEVPWLSCVVLLVALTTTGCSEEGSRVKRVRADSSGLAGQEPPQALDAEPEPAVAPPAFLSRSVKEYLELGMAIPGKPGTDYPVLGAVPYTNFYCDDQPYPGFFADMDTRCQAWHYCDIDGRQASFLCPNGTIFSQAVASCDWWFNVRCSLSPSLYPLNARLYRRRRKQKKPQPHRLIDKQLLDEIFL